MHAIDVVLFIHITAVIALFLTSGIGYAAMYGARRAKTTEVLRIWNTIDRRIGPIFPLGALVLAGAGAYMVNASSEFSMSDSFVQVGISTLVFIEIVGGVVLDGHARKVHKLLEATPDGALTPDLCVQVNAPAPVYAINLILAMVVGVIFIMATKPSLATCIGVVIGAGVVGVAGSLPFTRTSTAAAPTAQPELAV